LKSFFFPKKSLGITDYQKGYFFGRFLKNKISPAANCRGSRPEKMMVASKYG
jgi:hypothetical protein